MHEISGGAQAMVGQIGEITSAMAEQRIASESIARNVETIAIMTQDSDQAVRDIAVAFNELESLAGDLRKAAAVFRT